jgi:heme oxygenase
MQNDLCAHLRTATATAHGDLEQSVDLAGRIADRGRFVALLEGFHGFHLSWERAIRRRSDIGAFHAPRERLTHLGADLAALGRTPAEVDRLPVCEAAEALAATHAAAIGSMYVMEGSTLGGQVIDRALAGASWRPEGGLSYFTPYGARTGHMWREFRAWAHAEIAEDEREEAAAAANRTFQVLQAWLPG